ncbi:MAG: hypothetical protein ACRDDM_08110 [Paraclostridium sp.]
MTIGNGHTNKRAFNSMHNNNSFIKAKFEQKELVFNKHPLLTGVILTSCSIVGSVAMIFLFWWIISQFIKDLL